MLSRNYRDDVVSWLVRLLSQDLLSGLCIYVVWQLWKEDSKEQNAYSPRVVDDVPYCVVWLADGLIIIHQTKHKAFFEVASYVMNFYVCQYSFDELSDCYA